MSISAVSSSLVSDLAQQQNPFQQIKQDFKQLASALQSGNLSGAQSAYGKIQQVLQANQGPSSSSSASNTPSLLQSDFSTLGQALQSGNLSQAQSVFAQLQTDSQAGQAGSQNTSVAAQPPVQDQPVQDQYVPSAQTPSPAQQVRQDYSNLANSLQSGNLTNAQSSFAALEQALQTQAGSNGASNASTTTATSADPIANDLNSIGQALSAGSLTTAQNAFSQLQSDVQTAEQTNAPQPQADLGRLPGTPVHAHRHHRHGGVGDSDAATSNPTTALTASSTTSTTSTASSRVNLYG